MGLVISMRVKIDSKSFWGDNGPVIRSDQIGLQSQLYAQLFKGQFERDYQSKPWRRGIVCVKRKDENGKERKVRLLFRGVGASGIDQQICLLSREACQQLGIRSDDAEVGLGTDMQWYQRLMFYWNHPEHHARVAFKLGFVAVATAVAQLGIAVVF